MKLKDLNKRTPSLDTLSKKYSISKDKLEKELERGIEVELEHTDDKEVAKEIALDHLGEAPDYYEKLKKVEEDKC